MAETTTTPSIFTLLIPVRWGDLDAYGHVNNTVYFRFFEETRVAWLGSLGLQVDGQGEGPVLIKTGATFLREVNYPCTLRVETRVGEAGRSSLMTYHDLFDAETNVHYCTGEAKIVWVSHDTGKSTPLPDVLRQLAVSG